MGQALFAADTDIGAKCQDGKNSPLQNRIVQTSALIPLANRPTVLQMMAEILTRIIPALSGDKIHEFLSTSLTIKSLSNPTWRC